MLQPYFCQTVSYNIRDYEDFNFKFNLASILVNFIKLTDTFEKIGLIRILKVAFKL